MAFIQQMSIMSNFYNVRLWSLFTVNFPHFYAIKSYIHQVKIKKSINLHKSFLTLDLRILFLASKTKNLVFFWCFDAHEDSRCYI